MAISGMVGGFQPGSENYRHSGEKSSEPTANETNATFESFARSAGRSSVFGNTSFPRTKKVASAASFKD